MLLRFHKTFKWLMESITISLMVILTLIVLVAVLFRKAGASLSWYDEVSEVLLAWLTYYGSALAALSRGHIGFSGIINAMKQSLRLPCIVIGEAFVFGFFILLAWYGMVVLEVLEGGNLVSLPQIPHRLTQSVIPIGAVLFIIAEALSIPEMWKKAKSSRGIGSHDEVPIPIVDESNPEPAMEVPKQ